MLNAFKRLFAGSPKSKPTREAKSARSRPQSVERPLLEAIASGGVKTILEFGVGNAQRATRLMAAAARREDIWSLRYVGIDRFEENDDGTPLREVYQRLRGIGGAIRLLPGRLASVIPAEANSISEVDLLVIGAEVTSSELQPLWFYVPRMLSADAAIFVASGDEGYVRLTTTQVAGLIMPRRAA